MFVSGFKSVKNMPYSLFHKHFHYLTSSQYKYIPIKTVILFLILILISVQIPNNSSILLFSLLFNQASNLITIFLHIFPPPLTRLHLRQNIQQDFLFIICFLKLNSVRFNSYSYLFISTIYLI